MQSFALQQVQPSETEQKRGEVDEPHTDGTDVGLKKNTGEPGKAETFDQGHIEPHTQAKHEQQGPQAFPQGVRSYMLSSPTYSKEYSESIGPKHKEPQKVRIYC